MGPADPRLDRLPKDDSAVWRSGLLPEWRSAHVHSNRLLVCPFRVIAKLAFGRFTTAPMGAQEPQLGIPENQLEAVYETSLGALLVIDDERSCIRINDAGTRLLGASQERVLSCRLEHFIPSDHRPAVELLWADLERRGYRRGACELLRDDGSRTMIEYRATWSFGPGQHLIAAREIARKRARPGAGSPPAATLTPRQHEVLQLSANGQSTHEIARSLAISRGTVKTHLDHVYKKLHAHDRTKAVAEGWRLGLID
jgi:PAS domain S-box-containing protein